VKRTGGQWLARGLRATGLAASIIAVWRGGPWALVAIGGGFALAYGYRMARVVRTWLHDQAPVSPSDLAHTLDLLRRAHDATAAWAVGLDEEEVEAYGDPKPVVAIRERGGAIVQLASVDGRSHVAREDEGTYVAVGDFPYGAGLLLAERDADPEVAQSVTEELRRIVAAMRLAELEVPEGQFQLVAKQLAMIAAGAQTLEGVAKAGAELAQQLAQRGTAVVILDPTTQAAQVLAVSTAADRRLAGLTLSSEAPAFRAMQTGLPVVTQSSDDIFGPGVPERRRQERAGQAYPLMDGHFAIGALVLLGPAILPESPLAEQVGQLVSELGPRLAAARAVHEAEQRAVVDPLTGLRNRREFERQIEAFKAKQQERGERGPSEPVSLVYADLDRFKALNDGLGHAAGDAALRHFANVLSKQIRDRDLVARIGGEEFAVWLPGTPLSEGMEVAERIRRAVETEAWQWNGSRYPLTVSCGVAGYPESVGDVNNLRGAADAALYRAKQEGRNRVSQSPPYTP
jgi:diguanylate cyclase (GGDEF)-like protein